MDFIDSSFASLSTAASEYLPPGAFTNLIAQGIISRNWWDFNVYTANYISILIHFQYSRKAAI